METVHDCHLCSHFTLSNLKSTEMKDIVLHAKFIWTNPNALREYWTYEGYYALKSGYSLLACVYWFPNWSEKKLQHMQWHLHAGKNNFLLSKCSEGELIQSGHL